MNKNDRRLMKLTIISASILLIVCLVIAFMAFQRAASAEALSRQVVSYVESIPKPKDGKNATLEQVKQAVDSYIASNPIKDGLNGQNATDEQVEQAVEKYFTKNPIKQPKDGKDAAPAVNGANGKTPEIQCNVEKNRWEVRYGPEERWQLLNGQKVKCTVDEATP